MSTKDTNSKSTEVEKLEDETSSNSINEVNDTSNTLDDELNSESEKSTEVELAVEDESDDEDTTDISIFDKDDSLFDEDEVTSISIVDEDQLKSTDETEVISTSALDQTEVKEGKKKRKFKVPGAIAILTGVLIGAVVLTWIIHVVTVGDYSDVLIYTIDDAGLLVNTGTWTGGNNWYITEGANAIVNGQWVTIDYEGLIDAGAIINIGDSFDASLEALFVNPIIDDSWFNWSDSNWYISNDGMYGIGDVISATIGGVFSAADLIFFIIAIGVIIELLMETNVLKSLVNSLIQGMSGKRLLLVPTLFMVFAFWGTIMGTQEATLALIPIIVPALIIAGFDGATGFLVVLLGVTTGISASILEPFALGTLAAAFDGIYDYGTIGIGTGIVLRIVLFIVYSSIGMAFVTWYGHRVLKRNKSVETLEMQERNKKWATDAFEQEEHKPLDKKQKIALGIVLATLLWMVVVLLPWSSWIPNLDEQQWWISFSHLFFFKSLIGGWSFFQLGFLFAFGWFIAAKTFNYNGNQMKANWKNAFRTFRSVSIILILSRATSIVLTNSGTADYLAKTIFESATEGLGPLPLTLVVFPIYLGMAIFIPSMSGLAGISAPIISSVIEGIPSQADMLATIIGIMAVYPLAQGLVNMTSPTTGLVIAQAEASQTDYGRNVPLLLSYAGMLAIAGITIISLSFLV